MTWNLFMMKVLNNFWHFKHQTFTRICSEALIRNTIEDLFLKRIQRNIRKQILQQYFKYASEEILVEIWCLKFQKLFMWAHKIKAWSDYIQDIFDDMVLFIAFSYFCKLIHMKDKWFCLFYKDWHSWLRLLHNICIRTQCQNNLDLSHKCCSYCIPHHSHKWE